MASRILTDQATSQTSLTVDTIAIAIDMVQEEPIRAFSSAILVTDTFAQSIEVICEFKSAAGLFESLSGAILDEQVDLGYGLSD